MSDKKKEAYDQVKMEQFKESSRLEGMTPTEALDELVRWGEELKLYDLPPQGGITPDAWVIVEVNHEGEQFQKIIAGWSGGYLNGNSWRLSSPIKEMHLNSETDYITVETR